MRHGCDAPLGIHRVGDKLGGGAGGTGVGNAIRLCHKGMIAQTF